MFETLGKVLFGCFAVAVAGIVAVVVVTAGIIRAFMERAGEIVVRHFDHWLYVAELAALAVIFAFLYIIYTKRQENMLRQKDGAYMRQRTYLHALPLRLLRSLVGLPNPFYEVDPNLQLGPYVAFDGRNMFEVAGAAQGPERLGVRLAVERTNAVRAATPGDDAADIVNRPNVSFAGLGRLYGNGRTSAPQLEDHETVDGEFEVLPVEPVSALRSAKRRLLPLGTDLDDGALVAWDLETFPHGRVHGQTQGAGKTNLIKALVAMAAAQGYHVIVADRRQFKDWPDFSGKAEFVDTRDPAAFAHLIGLLWNEHLDRGTKIAQSGAPNLYASSLRLPSILVAVSEFSTLCSLAQGTGDIHQIQTLLGRMMAESAASGIHFLIEDQTVTEVWPRQVKTNAGAVFTGYLPLNNGQSGGYHQAHKLVSEYGRYAFHFDGVFVRAFDMKGDGLRLIEHAQPVNDRRLLLGSPFPVSTLTFDGERYVAPAERVAAQEEDQATDDMRHERMVEFAQAWNGQLGEGEARQVDACRYLAKLEGIKDHRTLRMYVSRWFDTYVEDGRFRTDDRA